MAYKRKNKNIIVTGSAGFIGFHLSKLLLELNFCIYGFDNLNSYYDTKLKKDRLSILKKFKNYNHYTVDIKNYQKIKVLLQKIRPGIVVNLAAQAGVRYSLKNPLEYIETNINGFSNILMCCKKFRVDHFIYASSSSVYGGLKQNKFSEISNTDKPISLYAATKKTNEILANSYSSLYKMKCSGLRFFTAYGPYGRPDMALFKFTRNILKGLPIQIFNRGKHLRDFTYVDDIVYGISKLILKTSKQSKKSNLHNIYNLGRGKCEKLSDFVKIIEKNLNIKSQKIYLPLQKGDVHKTHADISKAKRDFGYSPKITINQGIPLFISWYKSYYG